MPESSFSATISAWAAETKDRIKQVRDDATRRVIAAMQQPISSGGNMPVHTGFLWSSLVGAAGENLPPLVSHPVAKGESYTYDPSQVLQIIQESEVTETLTFVYTANYAIFQEYGTSHMAGHRFVGLAAQQWPQLVDQACKNAERFGGSGLRL